jgi:hypothetical protein
MRGRKTSDDDYLTGIPAGRRRSRFRASSRRFATRHPLIALMIGLAAMAGLTIYEVVRVVDARPAVGRHWALGVACGLAVAAACFGLLVVAYRVGKATRRLGPYSVIIVMFTISFGIVLHSTMPPDAQAGPYVVTTSFETGELTYLSVIGAVVAGLLAWAMARIIRQGRAVLTDSYPLSRRLRPH